MSYARKGWWFSASTEQRLAQIDGCIEVGMTAAQCAMNLGCVYDHPGNGRRGMRVIKFALLHGRNFSRGADMRDMLSRLKIASHKSKRDFAADKQAYLAGEPVDFWSAK